MSCNPAVGGLGKGHLVKEVDALDGQMARITDATGIQFRTLNMTKGPAVQATRVQADKARYCLAMKKAPGGTGRTCISSRRSSERLISDGGRVAGVETGWGEHIEGRSVVVTTGTFLNGLIHVGFEQKAGREDGRRLRPTGLAESLVELGFRWAG